MFKKIDRYINKYIYRKIESERDGDRQIEKERDSEKVRETNKSRKKEKDI